ncbi:hypothetical protein [Streptomyces tateyamensis]|uniref:hypothetical protein n=1 Tax=Streptomyces tateyamensis TaxID=565073 RepID=UPI0015E8946D|nr:hypothetical protein [Streptomyces tateyamensis]
MAGRIELDGIFGSAYRFDVLLTVDGRGMTTKLTQAGPSSPAAQEIAQPFGLPGLRITDLAADLAYRWGTTPADGTPVAPSSSTAMVRGTVLLGRAPRPGEADQRLACAARLLLCDGAAALFDVTLTADWSLGAFAAQCFTGTAATWPSDLIEVTLRAGSRIYYYDPAYDPARTLRAPDGTTPHEGFTIDAPLTVTLVVAVDLHGLVTVLPDPATHRYDRIAASLLLEAPVDLGFLALAGTERTGGTCTGGPALTLQSGPVRRAALTTGVNFLGEAFAVAEVSVTAAPDGGRTFAGKLTALRDQGPFGLLNRPFHYTTHPDREPEFGVEGWPAFSSAEDLVDFVSALGSLAAPKADSPCGPLTDLIAHQAFSTDYTISPSAAAEGGDLVFGLAGSCRLTLIGSQTPLLELDFPALTVRVPTATRWTDLPRVLTEGIRDGAARFALALLRDPGKTALFLAVVIGPQAVRVAEQLLCDGLVGEAVPEATAAAATALATAAAGGAVTAAAVTAAVAGIAAVLADPAYRSGGEPGPDLGTPVLRHAEYADGAVTVRWTGARRAAGYTLAVLRPDGTSLAASSLGPELSGSVPLDPEPLPAGAYQVRVRSTRGELLGPWSAPLTLTKPAAPIMDLTYHQGAALTISWTPAPGAEQVAVQLAYPTGGRLANTTRPAVVRELTVRLLPPQNGAFPLGTALPGAYTARTRNLMPGQFPGTWGSAALTVLSRPSPTILSTTQAGDGLEVSWRADAPCDLVVVDLTTSAVVATATAVSGGRAQLRPVPALVHGRRYNVYLRADQDGLGLSALVNRLFTALAVPAPARAALRNEAGAVTASWTAVEVPDAATAPTYTYELVDVSPGALPATVSSGTGIVGTSAPAVLAGGSKLRPLSTYRFQVRAELGGNHSPWTIAPHLFVLDLPAPLSPLLSIDDAGIALTWTDPPVVTADAARRTLTLTPFSGPLPAGAVHSLAYQAVLYCAGVEVARLDATTARWVVLSRTDGRVPVVGENYTARVRLATPDSTGPWAETPRADVLGRVQGARVFSLPPTMDPLVVTWTPPSVPSTGVFHEITATLDRTATDQPATGAARTTTSYTVHPATTTPTPNPPPALISTAGWRGTYLIRIRARTAQTTGPWTEAGSIRILDTGPV